MSRELVFFGFILGVFVRSFVDLGYSFAFLFAFCGALLFFAEYFYKNYLNKEVRLKEVAFIFIFFALGIGWYGLRAGDTPRVSSLRPGAQSLEVFVGEEPEEKNGKLNAVVTYNEEEKILIKSSLLPSYKYGDTLRIFGDLKKPENFNDSFDYISYLGKDDIYFLIDDARVKVLETGGWVNAKENTFRCARYFHTEPSRDTSRASFVSCRRSYLGGKRFAWKRMAR
ncbi:MAG TPA: DUF4131 domain-containing protein [Candidatus Paceibacterota bacterium]|nr:DUF4131 domain-containing protein [Candidatus Paceibacterota bacterium]